MIIWCICKYAMPQKYFFGTRHFYLSEEWVKTGHEVYLFTSNSNHLTDKLPVFKGRTLFEMIHGVKTYWLNTLHIKKGDSSSFKRMLSWFHFEMLFFFLKKSTIKTPDVIIVSSLSLLSVLNGLYYSWKFNAKFIFEVRDIWPLSLKELKGLSSWNPLMLFLGSVEKLGYKYCDAVVGTMPNLIEHVQNRIGKTDKCFTIPQGYSDEFYLKQEKLDHNYIKSFVPSDSFIVIYTGTISRNNPIEVLLKSARQLENESVSFLIVGEGNNKEFLKEKYKDLDNVIFAPAITKNKVNHLLSHADICFDSFSSSLARFGLSRNKWIDYMYAAKPIICSYSGFESMINEAEAGSFIEYNNVDLLSAEIMKYKNSEKRDLELLGKRAHDFVVTKRNFKKLARDYELIFNRI